MCYCLLKRTKKVVSSSLGLVDFAIGLVIFVLNLTRRASAVLWQNLNYRRIVIKKGLGASRNDMWASTC